jgi:hypothetical protein
MLTILIIVLVIAACGGFFWGNPGPGFGRWSPLGIVLVILLILWLTGNLGSFGGGDYHRHFHLFR